jgi:hypothetical protein
MIITKKEIEKILEEDLEVEEEDKEDIEVEGDKIISKNQMKNNGNRKISYQVKINKMINNKKKLLKRLKICKRN